MAVRNEVQANTSQEPNEVMDLAEGSSPDDFLNTRACHLHHPRH